MRPKHRPDEHPMMGAIPTDWRFSRVDKGTNCPDYCYRSVFLVGFKRTDRMSVLFRFYILCIILICCLHYWYCEKPSDFRNYGREEANRVQYESYSDEVDDSESIPETESIHETVAPTEVVRVIPSATLRPSLGNEAIPIRPENFTIPRRPKNLTLAEFGKYETNRGEMGCCVDE